MYFKNTVLQASVNNLLGFRPRFLLHQLWPLAALLCAAFLAAPASAATLTLACESPGIGAELCELSAREWAKKTGHTVKMVTIPLSSSERLSLYKQLLTAESPLVDVYMIDIVWPGIMADSLLDLKAQAAATIKDHFPAIVKNNTVDGRLIAMPWFTDAGRLYYRKDLLAKYKLPVPTTWAELTTTARIIQLGERKSGQRGMWGYLWQGRPYEGLTCDALEWIVSHGGGTVVDRDGTVTIDNPSAIAALRMAKNWIGDISPRTVLSANEEQTRVIFQNGNGVFLRNWGYVWSLVDAPDSPVHGKVGIAVLPRGPGGAIGTSLGGHNLAVSKFSRHPALATDLVMHLTGRAEQKRRAMKLGLSPTIGSLYQDPELSALNPYQETLRAAAASATPRPSTVTGRKYELVSTEFWKMVGGVLGEGKDPASSVKSLEKTLNTMHEEGKW